MTGLYYKIILRLLPHSRRVIEAKRGFLNHSGTVVELGAAHCQRFPHAKLHIGIELTHERAMMMNCDARVIADAHHLPFVDGSIDAIVGIDVLHHMNWRRVRDGTLRALRRGGVGIFIEPNWRMPWAWWSLFVPIEWGVFLLPRGRRFPVFWPWQSRLEQWLPSPTMVLEWQNGPNAGTTPRNSTFSAPAHPGRPIDPQFRCW